MKQFILKWLGINDIWISLNSRAAEIDSVRETVRELRFGDTNRVRLSSGAMVGNTEAIKAILQHLNLELEYTKSVASRVQVVTKKEST